MEKKTLTSMRFSPEALQLLELLSNHLGISKTAVYELAVRDFAKDNNISVKKGTIVER